ncbi:MAG TPA: hypothetical protein VHD91_05020, partial [Gaiellaceae bacterium]|nr:hypothetical protein [Gaiellaceae bacterium]
MSSPLVIFTVAEAIVALLLSVSVSPGSRTTPLFCVAGTGVPETVTTGPGVVTYVLKAKSPFD